MSDHPPGEGQPGRRRGFPIGLSIGVIAAVIVFGYRFNLFNGYGSIQADQARFSSWIAQVQKDNPSLKMPGMSVRSQSSLIGTSSTYQYHFESPTGRAIKIEADMNSGAFRGPSRVVFSAEGQSVSWPFEDIDRGRKLDLKVELPEAFR